VTTRYVENVPLIFEWRQREIVDDPLGKDIGSLAAAFLLRRDYSTATGLW